MKSSLKNLLFLVILQSIAILIISAQTRSVIIEVRDQEQNPVDRAEVRLNYISPALDSEYNAAFRESGVYEVRIPEHLIDNQFDLIVDGRYVKPVKRTIYWSGETRYTVSVETIPVSLFEMIVRDENNRPIRNARVTITADEIGTLAVRHLSDGEYRVDLPNSLINRQLNLEIAADGFETLRRSLRWRGDERISLNLAGLIKSLPFHIALSDQYDRPVTGARLIIRYEGREFIPASEVGGLYNFELRDNMVDQFIRIEVNADGYESLRESIHWTGTDRITRILESEPPPSVPASLIRISLRDRENLPVQQARVIVRPSEYAAYTALHQSNGMYESRIPDLREGMELAVEVEADNYESRSHRFIWRGAGHVEEITVSEIWRFALEVQLLDDVENQPVENARVRLLALKNGRTDEYIANSRGGGKYSFELPPGREYDRYTVAIAAQDYETIQRGYEPRMGESITYYISPVMIEPSIALRFRVSVFSGYGLSHIRERDVIVNRQSSIVPIGAQIVIGNRFQIGGEFNYGIAPMTFQRKSGEDLAPALTMTINQMTIGLLTKAHLFNKASGPYGRLAIGYYTGNIDYEWGGEAGEEGFENFTVELEDVVGFNVGAGYSHNIPGLGVVFAEAVYHFVERGLKDPDQFGGGPFRLNNFGLQLGMQINF